MRALFVYGTLLQGESRGHLIRAAHPLRIVPARTSGRLVDLGDYPGLVPADEPDQWVRGEFVEFPEPGPPGTHPLLAELDRVEEYLPGFESTSLYLRCAIPVDLGAGPSVTAWAYLYNRPCDLSGIIPSGDWRRRGR